MKRPTTLFFYLLSFYLVIAPAFYATAQRKKKGHGTKKEVPFESINKAEDDIQLVVYGDGNNKQQAVQNALRSAIEQAYGVFVSAHSLLVNDELVKDEIATVASGNIKAYKELSSDTMPNGRCTVSLAAIVSIGKLVSYVQAHGGSAEFAGQAFMMDIKMRELNRDNEVTILSHLYKELCEIRETLYNCGLELGEPRRELLRDDDYKVESINGWSLPLCVVISPTANLTNWISKCKKTLATLSLSETEISYYKSHNLEYFRNWVFGENYTLRSKFPSEDFDIILNDWGSHILINVNNGQNHFVLRPRGTYDRNLSVLHRKWISQRGDVLIRERESKKNRWLYESDSYGNFIKPFVLHAGTYYTVMWKDLRLKFDEDRYFEEHHVSKPTLFNWKYYFNFDLFFTEEEIRSINDFKVEWFYEPDISPVQQGLSLLGEFLFGREQKQGVTSHYFSHRTQVIGSSWSDWIQSASRVIFNVEESSIIFDIPEISSIEDVRHPWEPGVFSIKEYGEWEVDDNGWHSAKIRCKMEGGEDEGNAIVLLRIRDKESSSGIKYKERRINIFDDKNQFKFYDNYEFIIDEPRL